MIREDKRKRIDRMNDNVVNPRDPMLGSPKSP